MTVAPKSYQTFTSLAKAAMGRTRKMKTRTHLHFALWRAVEIVDYKRV